MAEGLFTLLMLSIVMAMASFFAGLLPLSISLSRTQLRLISIVGMGILVGTSLIVIIPEGVETLYQSKAVVHAHSKRLAYPLRSTSASDKVMDLNELAGRELHDFLDPIIPQPAEESPKTPKDAGKVGILEKDDKQNERIDEAHHAWIGIALIAGFIVMFLVDKIPQLTAVPSQHKARTHHIALNHIGRRFNLSGSGTQDVEESEEFLEPHSVADTSQGGGFATTIGLVIHAAADGIALGASSSTERTGLSLVIFFAIMIHKAPAAFGLTSILLRQGLSKRLIRAHLGLFSLAAPTGAILTWLAARFLSSGPANSPSHSQWWTGVLLLFSGGTFLYVAMHAMQQVLDSHSDRHDTGGHTNGSLEHGNSNAERPSDQKLSFVDIGTAVFGMILPLFLQVGHTH